MMGVGFFNMIFCFAFLLVEKVLEVTGRKRYDVGRVLLYHCLRIVFQNVGQLVRYHDLLCTVNPLLSHICHLFYYFTRYFLFRKVILFISKSKYNCFSMIYFWVSFQTQSSIIKILGIKIKNLHNSQAFTSFRQEISKFIFAAWWRLRDVDYFGHFHPVSMITFLTW